MTKHYRISPSQVSRLLRCHGSLPLLENGVPFVEIESTYAAEGSLAHRVAADMLRMRPISNDIEPEMLDACHAYLTFIHEVPQALDWESSFIPKPRLYASIEWIEETFASSVNEDFGGTADYVHVTIDKFGKPSHLIIVDFKYGVEPVDAQENPQLLCYAALVQDRLQRIYGGSRAPYIALAIVQPRLVSTSLNLKPSVWFVEDDIVQEFEQRLYTKMAEEPVLTTGQHCRYCPALTRCPAAMESTRRAVQLKDAVDNMDAWLEFMEIAPILKAMLEAIPQKMQAAALLGMEIPGFKLIEFLGHRQWALNDETLEKRLRGRGLLKAQIFEQKVRSPTQIEKLGKPLYEKVEDLVHRPAGVRLVPEHDKRPAVKPQEIPTDPFSVISEV